MLFRVRYLEDDLRAKRETDIISYRPQIVFAQVKQANPCDTFLFLLNMLFTFTPYLVILYPVATIMIEIIGERILKKQYGR